MHIPNGWNRALVLFVALAASVSAGATSASPQAPTLTDEQRRKLQEKILEQFEKVRQEGDKKAAAGQPGTPPAPAPAPAAPGIVQRGGLASDQLQLSYDNADLYDFINQVTDALVITPIVIDPDVKGSVTIHSSGPMPMDDVFPLFNLILKNNNAALVKQGNIYQIVPISSALKKGLEIIVHLPPPAAKPSPESPADTAAPAATKPGAAAPAPKPGTPPPQTPPPPDAALATSPATGAAATPVAATSQTPAGGAAPPGQAPATSQSPAAQQAPSSPPPPQAVAAADSRAPRLATHVLRVEFIPVKDLIEPIKLLMTDGGVIMPYDRLNMLILTDYSDSVARIMQVVRMLDDSYLDPDLVELIRIKYNASVDVVDDLRKIFGSGTKESPTGISFVSLDRMNAIMVMANSKRALEEVKRWIGRLDATTGRTLQTFVYTVENSTAANIALILSALYGGEGGTTGTTGTGTGTTGTTGGYGFGGTTGAPRTGGQTGTFGGFGTGGGGGLQGGAATTGVSTPFGSFGSTGTMGQTGGGIGGLGAAGGGGGAVFGGTQLGPRLNAGVGTSSQVLRGGGLTGLQESVRVVVDEINNSLILQASAADYAYIVEVIKKLDVLPRQALIDARIFEIDLTDTFSFGVSAMLQGRTNDAHLTTGKLSTAGGITADTFAFIGNGREILMSLDLLREKTNVRILEAPSVLALDGTEAKIVVGGEVPYTAGSFVTTSGNTTSVQYRETGVQLLVVPRISASGTVTLAIAQEVSSLGSVNSKGDPSFNKTSVTTTLAVRDGETVAIAGLIRDNNNQAKAGVPFLADIPLLGGLFGKVKRTVTRTELLILITPHVVKTPERFQEMTQELRDSLRNMRPFVESKEKEHLETMEDARKARSRSEEKIEENRSKNGKEREGRKPAAEKPEEQKREKKQEKKEAAPAKKTEPPPAPRN
jgi:general secretion pathway protein D